MRLLAKGTECILKLEDKVSGELFAKCPVDTYPGIAIEAVSDSSRYFVVRIQDDSGRAAFIGVGFADRSDSFDLNVALQDHFKWVKQSQEIEKEGTTEEAAKPRLDLSFKAGETIKINMKIGVLYAIKVSTGNLSESNFFLTRLISRKKTGTVLPSQKPKP
jgi:hypothetical protein